MPTGIPAAVRPAGIDTPVQAIFVQEIVEELGFTQLFMLENIRSPNGYFVSFHQWGDGVIELKVSFILLDIGWVHIDLDGATE
jgi:hypothetical protein